MTRTTRLLRHTLTLVEPSRARLFFRFQHPGGDEVLFGEAGRDATEAFEDVGHSDEARSILDKYYVGEGPEVSLSLCGRLSAQCAESLTCPVYAYPGHRQGCCSGKEPAGCGWRIKGVVRSIFSRGTASDRLTLTCDDYLLSQVQRVRLPPPARCPRRFLCVPVRLLASPPCGSDDQTDANNMRRYYSSKE